MSSLPLSSIVNVTYDLPAAGAPLQNFNLGLIIGTSSVINTTDRVAIYSSLAEMVTAGFTTNSAEYLAATAYFSANPAPNQVAIGRQASGESCLTALTACRAANDQWYIAYIPGAGDSDHTAIAAYVETLTSPYTMYFLESADAAVLNNTGGNLFATLKGSNYQRTFGLYSTSAHAVAGLMGYAMGQTTDLAGSAYTLFGKQIPGATVETLTTTQVNNITGNNGNVYVNYGNFYNITQDGKVFSGAWFDEIIYLDKLANEIQINVANLLYQTPKVPQTEGGMAQLRTVISQACDQFVSIGFIAPGEWMGSNVLTLQTGTFLATGYMILSDALDAQSQGNRDARIAPNIYVCAKLAGAIQSVFIKIEVNR